MAKFVKGQTGNPGGRPKIPSSVVEAAKAHTVTALNALARIAEKSPDDAARVRACEALLNRAWGKPVETHEVTGKDGGPIESQQPIIGLAALRAALAADAPP